MIKQAGLAMLSLIAIAACSKSNAEKEAHGFNKSNMDTTVSPGTDFYEYANGGWLEANPVPPDKSSYTSFNDLLEHNRKILKDILEDASKVGAEQGTIKQRVGDFYTSGMDTTAIDKAGISPIQPYLNQVDQISDKASLMKEVADLRKVGLGSMYGFYVNQDDKNATKMAAYISQGGLGLPDRDYYLKDQQRFQHIRSEYIKHMTRMFKLLGDNEATAKQKAQTVMDIEKNMAGHSMTRVERRDPDNTYHKKTIAELNSLSPNIDWKQHLDEMGIDNIKEVIVNQPEFVKNLSSMVDKVSLDDWKTYLKWHVITNAAPYLSSDFEKENFSFYGKVLQGRKEMEPRWKRVLQTIDNEIGMDLGQLYVKRAFPPEAKKKAMEMINDIKAAFREHIQNLEWMSDETKKKALVKLNSFYPKIGYPDKWRDYSSVRISKDSYMANIIESDKFGFHRMINKLGKPVDREEWYMTPPTVNAYYNPNMNEIVFPAGILQPPFFDFEADAALNYGGMGAVIGHEMTHGFDDQGSKYDADGNLNNWWTKQDRENFDKRAQKVIDEYSNFVVLDSLHVNGKLTLGENIADLGGMSLAYDALQKYYEKHGRPEKIQGFTPEQRFFLAWARIWRANYTPENLQNRIMTDPHSPGRYRTIGVVTNMDPFYNAFDVTKSDSMFVPDARRSKIW